MALMKKDPEIIDLLDDSDDEQKPTAAKEQLPAIAVGKQRVAKYFEDERLYFGTVKKHYEPESSSGEHLWRIAYDDGDAEDLNQWELHQAIQLYKQEGSRLDIKKSPPRRQNVTPSPVFHDVKMNNEESDDEVQIMVSSSITPARKRHLFTSDDEGNESSGNDEPTPKRLGKIKSLRARKKYARLEQEAWLGVDESDDSDDDSVENNNQGFPANRRRRRLQFGIPPLPPVPLTQVQQQGMLSKIDKPQDKALQKLLINQDFQFLLLPHQFLAVRKVAGVPDKFPLHHGSQVTVPEEALISDALVGLDLDVNRCTTKGVLVADDMGLGKTVEAIAGAILRNAMTAAKNDQPRPTLIVSPNDAVQVQWRDTLVNNGIPLEDIHMFQVGQHSRDFDRPIFLLMTRYTLQSEIRRVFANLWEAKNNPEAAHLATSVLFPHADLDNLERLHVQYQDDRSKARVDNKWREKGESVTDCVTRLVNLCTRRMRGKPNAKPVFEMFIIDEAHFLKNVCTYWGLGAALISTHSRRSAPLTGTPYNNGPTDLAAIMTFIDAAKPSAKMDFWASATSKYAMTHVKDRVAQWHSDYLVRRRKEDVLKDLVEKTVESRIVHQFAAEQGVYNFFEEKLLPILKQYSILASKEENPVIRKQLKELKTIILSIMSSLRAANIHAMLPGGREYTKQFSPTRQHLRAMEERSNVCVCCDQNMRPSIPSLRGDDDGSKHRAYRRRFRGGTANMDELEEFKDDDDALEMYEEEEDEELVALPCSLCEASNGPVSHFVHQECLDAMLASGDTCPRCQHAKNATQFKLPDDGNRRYCTNIAGGFVGSSKINSIVDWYQNEVPVGDKVLILSFYKGGLDLLEGIFCHDLGVDCARFDGDLDRRESIAELERFKREPDCKILLASVQSGGVGLNIVEANHVAFCDRWYNPFVHQQAEDRCHRIGQTKDVFALYFDAAATGDEAMVQLNKRKMENSAILLADGVEIGHQQEETVSHQDLSGVLVNLLSVIRSHRTGWLESNAENTNLPIPAVPQSVITNALEGKIAQNSSAARRDSSTEERQDETTAKDEVCTGALDTDEVIVIDDSDED